MAFARTDRSILGRWWWTVDRWSLLAIGALMAAGAILILAASPAAGALIVGFSLLSVRWVRRAAVIGLLASLVLLVVVLVIGPEIKGATRWLPVMGISLQPSEFAKPFLAVFCAWMFATARIDETIPGTWIALGVYLLVAALIIMQPDLGQTFVVTAVFGAQWFLAGLPIVYVVALAGLGVAGLVGSYLLLPHVAQRIDTFLDPASGDSYQIERSMQAFTNGGLFGRGPGEGTVKAQLPDAHADFIFAVAGEEFGALACLLILAVFAFVVLRGFSRVFEENNLFIMLAVTGLLTQFGLQALINMASSLHLVPTKGMTLPFISYGGSSLIALAITMGMVLALTRRRVEPGEVA